MTVAGYTTLRDGFPVTSEIALINRNAIALAADSASTVTYWDKGQRRERYFKGANKIFNLSAAHPVAMMTYDSGTAQGVPWEVIAKAFREELGAKAFDHLPSYATALFEFIQNNLYLYPAEFQNSQFFSDVRSSAGFVCFLADRNEEITKEKDATKKKAMASHRLTEIGKAFDADHFIGDSKQAEVDDVLKRFKKEIIAEIGKADYLKSYLEFVDVEQLVGLAVLALFKRRSTVLDTTGLVIAGFGDKDFFPRLELFNVTGAF